MSLPTPLTVWQWALMAVAKDISFPDAAFSIKSALASKAPPCQDLASAQVDLLLNIRASTKHLASAKAVSATPSVQSTMASFAMIDLDQLPSDDEDVAVQRAPLRDMGNTPRRMSNKQNVARTPPVNPTQGSSCHIGTTSPSIPIHTFPIAYLSHHREYPPGMPSSAALTMEAEAGAQEVAPMLEARTREATGSARAPMISHPATSGTLTSAPNTYVCLLCHCLTTYQTLPPLPSTNIFHLILSIFGVQTLPLCPFAPTCCNFCTRPHGLPLGLESIARTAVSA